MDVTSEGVNLKGRDSDAFLTDQEEWAQDRSLPRTGRECACSGGDVYKWSGVSQDLISLEEGEIRDESMDVSSPVIGKPEGPLDPAAREILEDVVRWRQQWASRPGVVAPVSLVVDRYGQYFDHRDRLMVIQKVNQSDFGQLADLVEKGEVDTNFDKIIFMVGWRRDWSLSKARIVTNLKRLVRLLAWRQPQTKVGVSGLIPNYWGGPQAVMKAVNFNRNISTGVNELARSGFLVQYLPLHLHFQVRDDVEDRQLYLHRDGILTRRAAFCLRGILLQEFGFSLPPVELP